ncbi:Ferredoxin [Citrus sinensis]|uniref:Ferredoxin n=1 Tax=Citrus sinensis TaxID=2711 RepID=A0ACB8L888_CITSI|nr:Ferredoxin [Citrus sinensis]
MDLLVPPSSCCRKPPLHRQLPSSTYNNTRNPSSLKCRPRKTVSSELQTTAGVNGSYSPSIPTHKVTVHDRFRGVVHEFLVPEGYALLCVGYPSSDVEVETQDEDEVYWLQFGRYFARGPVERDDYALELALGDE